ncbi:CHRD domain-containing protein [Streptomyces sp. YIM S03343]
MGISAARTMRRRTLIATGAALAAAAGVAAGTIPAVAVGRTTGTTTSTTASTSEAMATAETEPTTTTVLATVLRDANEVPVAGGPATGDENGSALEFIKIEGDRVSVAVTWQGTGRPTALHLHRGAKGTSGDVVVDLSRVLRHARHARHHSVTGTVEVKDPTLLSALTNDPGSFYANLHTRAFPGGAVRGQLHKVTVDVDFRHALRGFRASVVQGKQIYECKATGTGGYAFAQRDVSARLEHGIRHSFVAPNSGTPQWVAPDGSAVTGAVLSRTPNGDGNIPELDLKATQSGEGRGLLAGTVEVLRLNTAGGTAPAGSCTSGDIVEVPYHADYVFVQG